MESTIKALFPKNNMRGLLTFLPIKYNVFEKACVYT